MGVPWRICIAVGFLMYMYLGCCNSQDASACRMATSCSECISVGPDCAWCAQRDFFNASCDSVENLLLTNCSDIQNPAYSINITKDEALSNAGDAALGQAVQVQPQEIRLKIRRGETARIRMNIRQAEDYPVDMYFLMDLSQSMREDLETLRSLATDLVAKMQELTRNFQVGFGSFVDKNVIPFASLQEDGNVLLDCAPLCEDPYLFKNGQTLTNSSDLFEQTLGETGYSTSKDQPEAGLDALVQVAVCDDIIGWRESSRHLVVFLTDAPYHAAGDGRLGGIVTPNDGMCHVDPVTGEYKIDKLQDYPSIGQLSSLVLDKDIVIMFVVGANVQQNYRDILPFFPTSQIGTLAANSDNIVYWIENLYNKITSEVTLSVQAPEELLLEFTAQCDNITEPVPGETSCDGLSIGDEVWFDIDVTAESCVEGGSTSFSVSPVGFSEELLVYVDVICSCECEEKGIPNSPLCNYNGTNQCGMCACNAGQYGDECQCSGDSASVGDDRLACIGPGSSSICSGRGECICGDCVCNIQKDPTHVVSGAYCQCDNFNCPLFEGQLCGGPSRGTCICDPEYQSKCQCTPEYEGDSCSCLTSQEACISPNGLICNAHGSCTCGACRCNTDSPFKGSTCFDCATCTGQCEVYQECVQCKAFESGPLTKEQCDMCSVEVIEVEKFPEVEYPYNCSVNHIDNCSIVFIPHFINGEDQVPVIYVLDSTVCPRGPVAPGVDARWVAVGLAITIVLIGILLIILYKCYITYLDRKEYREWEKERANAKFSENENPLYKPAQTVHKNPAYGVQFSDSAEPLQEKS